MNFKSLKTYTIPSILVFLTLLVSCNNNNNAFWPGSGSVGDMSWTVSRASPHSLTFRAYPKFDVSFIVVHYTDVNGNFVEANNYFLKQNGPEWFYTTGYIHHGILKYYFTYCATDEIQRKTGIYEYFVAR